MSDTKYNFDDYIFDNVLEDTYLAIKDVRENIDRWVKETREIDFDYNPYEGRDEREKLDGVITKNIVDSIKDRLYNVDFENKVMRGVNVEAVRDIVGPQVFDDFFQTDVILPKPMDPEVAVQLLSPSESVKYCARLDEPYYPKAFSKLMLKSTVDTLCDLYKSRRYGFDILSSAFGNLADHIHEAKQVAEDLSYDVGALLVHLVIFDVLVLPRFVRPRFARRPCPSGLVHRASSMSKQKLNPCELSQGFLL